MLIVTHYFRTYGSRLGNSPIMKQISEIYRQIFNQAAISKSVMFHCSYFFEKEEQNPATVNYYETRN